MTVDDDGRGGPTEMAAGATGIDSATWLFAGPGDARAHARALDWAATPLGPVDCWSPALLVATQMVLASGLPNILLWGRELTQIYNDAYAALIRAKHPVALGRGNREVWPEVWHLNGPIYERVFAGETVTFEDAHYPLERRDAGGGWALEEAYLTISYSPVRDETGAVAGVLANMIETTGQVRERAVLATLAESEARFRNMADAAPVMLWVTEADGTCTFLNQPWYEFTGQTPATGLGFGWLDATHPDDRPMAERVFREATERREGFRLDYRLRRRDGEYRWAVDAAAPRFGPDGAFLGYIGSVVDVEERARLLAAERAARRDADQARSAAERADRAKSEFLATMSHEIRTPINAILGYGELLDLGIAGPVTERQRDYLARLRASGQHLSHLVSDVLDLAKVDAGQMPVAHEHSLTGEAVQAALALVLPQAQAKGVALRSGRPGEAGVDYVGDAGRVRQILVNLLSNAVKFTPAGGTVSVDGGLRPDAPPAAHVAGMGPWAFVRVADTGIGIASEDHAAIFEPFVQAERGHTRTAGGTGLGLAISRRFARLMGGDLVLEHGAPGEGAVFTLWLPAAAGTGGDGDGDAMRESAAARAARASREVIGYRVHGLGEIGTYLRAHGEALLEAYVARLRGDSAVPGAAWRTRAELEDHTTTLIGNLAQSLVLIEQEGGLQSDLLRDGGEIQRVVADLHGRARRRAGWTEGALAREYEVLTAEVVALVRRHVPEGTGDVDVALEVLRRLLARAAETSVRAFRHAPAPVAGE